MVRGRKEEFRFDFKPHLILFLQGHIFPLNYCCKHKPELNVMEICLVTQFDKLLKELLNSLQITGVKATVLYICNLSWTDTFSKYNKKWFTRKK